MTPLATLMRRQEGERLVHVSATTMPPRLYRLRRLVLPIAALIFLGEAFLLRLTWRRIADIFFPVSIACVLALFLSVPVLAALYWLRRKGQHLCWQCEYDLRGCTGCCPECGFPVRESEAYWAEWQPPLAYWIDRMTSKKLTTQKPKQE